MSDHLERRCAVLVEHDRGVFHDATLEALTAARALNTSIVAVVCGGDGDYATVLHEHGASSIVRIVDPLLADYGPEAWGESVAQWLATRSDIIALLACGTDRGNEVLAQVAARLDLPMVANCLPPDSAQANPTDDSWSLTRVQWGGSLLEDATLNAALKLLTIAHHSVEASPAPASNDITTTDWSPSLDPSFARTVVRDRVVRGDGVTLTTARVVVGGGRGVGSPEGFAPLEELAALLNGKVGCSRAVTNNGWRNHADQVGQTGTRIAPDIYLACGISGAIQHWVGAMASKTILAINTDKDANMVTRADYAVIGDLHKVIPAISEEIRRRRAT